VIGRDVGRYRTLRDEIEIVGIVAAVIPSILYADTRGFVGEHDALRSEIALISSCFGDVCLGGLSFPAGRLAGR
jgi:hypothetical protein